MENQAWRKRKSEKKLGMEGWHFQYRGTKIKVTSNFSSETIQARRMQSEIFKVFREKSHQPVPGEIIFQKWRTNKDFLRQTKIEGICYQCIYLARNVKWSSFERRKIISVRNSNLYKERKSIKEGMLLSQSVVSDSFRPHRRQPTRLPRPWDSPGKNTGVGCHFLLQRRNRWR